MGLFAFNRARRLRDGLKVQDQAQDQEETAPQVQDQAQDQEETAPQVQDQAQDQAKPKQKPKQQGINEVDHE
jgi:hypothetical protein